MRESGCGWCRSSGRQPSRHWRLHWQSRNSSAFSELLLLFTEPSLSEHPCRSTESFQYVHRVPKRRHGPLFERGHEDAVRDSVGGIGRRLTIRDHLKLLHNPSRFEEEFADLLEEKDGAVGGIGHSFAQTPEHVAINICFNIRIVSVRTCHVPVQLTPR